VKCIKTSRRIRAAIGVALERLTEQAIVQLMSDRKYPILENQPIWTSRQALERIRLVHNDLGTALDKKGSVARVRVATAATAQPASSPESVYHWQR
jgi:hypothetical protein